MTPDSAVPQPERVAAFFRKHRTGLVTLVFTDLVDSTRLKQQLGDTRTVALVQQHHARVRDWLSAFAEAVEIETAGDSFLLLFARPSDAVRFALGLHRRNRQLSVEAGVKVEERTGIHAGEVFVQDQAGVAKLFGSQVDVCGRLVNLAQGGQVLVTRFVFDNARAVLRGTDLEGVEALQWVSHGPYLLKGIEEPMEVCEVGEAGRSPLAAPQTSEKARRVESADGEAVLGWRPAVGQEVPNTPWVLEQKLGEGGFGEVWVAQHRKLKERRVFKFCFRTDRVRALKREMTLFRLLKEHVGEHPNIVRLHEVYLEAPPFYLEEEYVAGNDLKTWCETQGGAERVPLEMRLEIVAQVADALQAAHDAGVIHRDVKPGNILVRVQGSVARGQKSEVGSQRPAVRGRQEPGDSSLVTRHSSLLVKLTDFGIGQVVSEEALAGVTRAGFTQTMLGSTSSQTGTQLYLAPELLAGKPASTRSDIYSLGVVLYQLLVGDFTRPVTTDWAGGISDPLLRDDVRHCFAGNPSDRFAGVGQLAKNLRGWDQRRQELLARERIEKAAALRHRIAVLSGGVAVVFLLLAVALGYGLRQAERAKAREAQLRKQAQAQAYASDMKAAQVALQQNNRGMALNLLRQYLPQPGEEDLRGLEWRYLWQESRSDEHQNFPHPAGVYGAALSPDGRYLATASYDSKIRLWEVTSARQIQEFDTRGPVFGEARSLRRTVGFSSGGERLAALGKNGVEIRETTGWSVVKELKLATAPVAFSADGRFLVTGGTNGMRFWNQSDWSCRVLTNAFATGSGFALTPGGTSFASYYVDRDDESAYAHARIELWDVRTRAKREIEGTEGARSLAISPDGKWLAYGTEAGEVGIWSLPAWVLAHKFRPHRGMVHGLAFSPDGKRLATGGIDQQIRIWETGTTNLLGTRTGHLSEIWSLDFSQDGQRLVSSSMDGTAKLWEAGLGSARSHTFAVPAKSYITGPLPDLSAVMTINFAGNVQLWRLPDGELIRTMPFSQLGPEGQGSYDVLTIPVNQALVGVTTNGLVCFFNPSTGALLRSVQAAAANFMIYSVSPDQRWLTGLLPDSSGMLCDLRQPSQVQRLPDYVVAVGYATFSPDSRWLAYATTNNEVKLWDLAANRVRAVLKGHRRGPHTISFSPDGKWLASGGRDGDVWLWSVNTAKPLLAAPLKGHMGTVNTIVFSSDNRTLATFGRDQTMRWWNVATGREMLSFPSEPHWAAEPLLDFPAPGNSASRLVIFYERPGQIRITTVLSLKEIDAIEKGTVKSS